MDHLSSCEKGKTLLEVIGVIGIMGVLTAGALAGYQYALQNIRANSVGETLVAAASNIRKLYSWQRDYSEIGKLSSSALMYKLCKEEVFLEGCTTNDTDKSGVVKHALGGDVLVAVTTNNPETFEIQYTGLTSAQCYKLVMQNLNFVDVYSGEQRASSSEEESGEEGGGGSFVKHPAPVTAADASTICGRNVEKMKLNFVFN